MIRVALLLALSVLLGACGLSLSRPAPTKQTFLLHATRADAGATSVHPHVLRVNRFDIAQPFNGKSLVYRTSETGFETDYYNEFVAAPAGMLTERATVWLRQAGVFRNIIPMTSSLEHRYLLEATGAELYGDFRDAAQPIAALALRVYVARDDDKAVIVYDKTLARRVPIASRTPEAVVMGLDRALEGILRELETDLARLDLKDAN
jgi:cholesterol transport system auxiliary component